MTIIYVHVDIILDLPITYEKAQVLCQSECSCSHHSVDIVVFFTQNNENTYPKGRTLMQMYRIEGINNAYKNIYCYFMQAVINFQRQPMVPVITIYHSWISCRTYAIESPWYMRVLFVGSFNSPSHICIDTWHLIAGKECLNVNCVAEDFHKNLTRTVTLNLSTITRRFNLSTVTRRFKSTSESARFGGMLFAGVCFQSF